MSADVPSSASHPLYYLPMVVGDTKGGTHQSAGRSERRRMASVKSGGSDGDFERFTFGRSAWGPLVCSSLSNRRSRAYAVSANALSCGARMTAMAVCVCVCVCAYLRF